MFYAAPCFFLHCVLCRVSLCINVFVCGVMVFVCGAMVVLTVVEIGGLKGATHHVAITTCCKVLCNPCRY